MIIREFIRNLTTTAQGFTRWKETSEGLEAKKVGVQDEEKGESSDTYASKT